MAFDMPDRYSGSALVSFAATGWAEENGEWVYYNNDGSKATDVFKKSTSEEEDILRSERDARLWDAIDRLPPERKKIFLLSKRDGLKYQEIAEELNLSVKTVENQMSKALKALRETAIRVYMFFFG